MVIEYQNIIQVATICLLAAMGIGRILVLKSKKTQVLVLDSQMNKSQLINGYFFIICFLSWIFESISYSFALNYHIPIPTLETMIVQYIGIKIAGVMFLFCGLIIYASALYSMRNSWRIGIDRENPGQLITDGLFKVSRNPIYLSLDLIVAGTFLLQGRFVFLMLFVLISVSLHIQVLHEERFLTQTYGNLFLKYSSEVGRYLNIKSLFR
jgi:protein-S-isoprenylcysteine O-methyltransferase Ste14